MKRIMIISLLQAFICISTARVWSQSNELHKFRSDYVKAMVDAKPEMIHAWYGDSVRFLTEFQKTVLGKDNALQYYRAFLSRFTIKAYTRTEIEVLDLGGMIAEFGSLAMTIESKTSHKTHELKGNYINIWKRIAPSKLSLIIDGWDYNHQVDLGDQLRFPEVPAIDMALQSHLPVTDNITLELAALNSLLENTISEHDGKIWAQFYADDAIVFSRRRGAYKGRKEIDEHIIKHATELPIFEKLDLRHDRIDDLGKYVIEYATGLAVWRSGEYSGVNTGKDIRIWRREPSGTLKIFRQIGMYD